MPLTIRAKLTQGMNIDCIEIMNIKKQEFWTKPKDVDDVMVLECRVGSRLSF